ncbi:MAG: hypothetical protein ACM32O_05420 [Clostridia bacterium]
MGFRTFRYRQGFAAKRVVGIALAVGGLTILLYSTPVWVMYASIGASLMGVGWFLFNK